MVTENNDHVSEGQSNDQMKYSRSYLEILDCRAPRLWPRTCEKNQPQPAAIAVWSGGQIR